MNTVCTLKYFKGVRLALDIGKSEDMVNMSNTRLSVTYSSITCIWAEALRTREGFNAILSREITHVNSKFPPANLKEEHPSVIHNALT